MLPLRPAEVAALGIDVMAGPATAMQGVDRGGKGGLATAMTEAAGSVTARRKKTGVRALATRHSARSARPWNTLNWL